MKLVLLGILLTVGGTLLAMFIQKDSGYILIGYDVYAIEMSLTFFSILLLIVIASLIIIFNSSQYIITSPGKLKLWNQRRSENRAQLALADGLMMESEGQWKQAEKKLLKHAKKAQDPTLGYLAAARAAQAQGDQKKIDKYLQLAYQNNHDHDMAITLTQAELFLNDGKYEQALASLVNVKHLAYKNKTLARLLSRTYEYLQDWDSLSLLLPDLEAHLNKEHFQDLQYHVYQALLKQAEMQHDPLRLHNIWTRMPRPLRQDHRYLVPYIKQAIRLDSKDSLDRLILDSLKKNWSSDLASLYGDLNLENRKKQLSTAEQWLVYHGNDAKVLLSCAKICLRQQLWGKARSYLESSLALQKTSEALYLLASLLDKLKEPEEANRLYREGLALAAPVTQPIEFSDTQSLAKVNASA